MWVYLHVLSLVFYANALTIQSSVGGDSEISRTITMDLESRMTCFYETLEKGMVLDLAYTVPYDSAALSMRLTSPSGQFSDWANGEDEVTMSHNVSENGDYEICLSTPSPLTVSLSIFFRDPEKMEKAMDRYLEAHQIRGNLKVN
ncbi:hypothetical protein ANCCEY_02431 [Ancylostoma ceylanicum]|uniref:GOLD domain-containing protein n=4 Tax=Ancylostoma ceylanicum TaxID=53326 RepID=A0A0D6M7S2_9BILA|nr:hypothetical protein ANCCEY_02431 [Ancylostoma ceylanicum]EYC15868.1 hypothetical protein Y032_0035g3011 [Ancylostoma ceylanicum]